MTFILLHLEIAFLICFPPLLLHPPPSLPPNDSVVCLRSSVLVCLREGETQGMGGGWGDREWGGWHLGGVADGVHGHEVGGGGGDAVLLHHSALQRLAWTPLPGKEIDAFTQSGFDATRNATNCALADLYPSSFASLLSSNP